MCIVYTYHIISFKTTTITHLWRRRYVYLRQKMIINRSDITYVGTVKIIVYNKLQRCPMDRNTDSDDSDDGWTNRARVLCGR